MASIIKVDTIQDQDGNNIISEAANTITIGASGDTITIPSGATLANSGIVTGFQSTGIDDNATSTAITIDSSQDVGIGTVSPNTYTNYQTLTINGTTGGVLDFESNGTLMGEIYCDTTRFLIDSEGAVPLVFRTNSASERMRIDSSGNVGIGTSTPTGSLHVYNSSGSQAYITNRSSGSAELFVGYWNEPTYQGLSISRTYGSADVTYNVTQSGGQHLFKINSTEAMRIDSSGNVGINNTIPSSFQASARDLVVGSGSGNQGMTIYSGGTSYGGIHFADGTTGNEAYRGIVYYQHTTDNMQFWTAASERMRINSSGNVGIGTTNPLRDLHVSNSGAEGYEFGPGETSNVNQTLHYNRATSQYIAHQQRASQHQFDIDTTEKMRINNSGNVLIGNTNNRTLANLEVNNSIGLQSDVFYSIEIGKGYQVGSGVSTITLSYEANFYAAHTMIETQMHAYNNIYLDHLLGWYTQFGPAVMRNNNNGSTVAISFSSTGTYTAIVSHVITLPSTVGYPIVKYKISRGGGTGEGFITKPTITFA